MLLEFIYCQRFMYIVNGANLNDLEKSEISLSPPWRNMADSEIRLSLPAPDVWYIHLSLRDTGAPVGAPVFAGTLPCKSLARKRGAVKSRQNESRIRNSLHPQESLGDFEDAVESVIHRSANGHPRKSMDFLRVSMPFE